jgi:general secretion pathway protein K
MEESTATSYALATTERDQLRAEYLARSAVNLTRLLVAQQDAIQASMAPLFMMMAPGRPPPPISPWVFANEVLKPFCDFDSAQATGAEVGFDFGMAEGLGDTGGRCELIAFAENSRINVNEPLHFNDERARLNVAMQIYAMIGGYQSPSPSDPLFERQDADGQQTTRLDVVSAVVDWWDQDTQRSNFDPGAATMPQSGAEDDVYSRFRDPYEVKNAPFDSVEELRLIRGVGDDFWATFVEDDPDDPNSRKVTVYGSGAVNVNEALPQVLYARTCSYLFDQTLCSDPAEAAKFMTLLSMAKSFAPGVPLFSNVQEYFQFLQGQGWLYQTLSMFASGLLFRPIAISPAAMGLMGGAFIAVARIITVQATGLVGNCPSEEADGEEEHGPGRCTRVRIRSVLNFDNNWTPPPPNAGAMPRMGVFHYWRIE